LGIAALITGCNHAAYWLHAIAPPPPMKTVEAECNQLPGKSVAIVIFADQSVQYEYPMAKVELSAALGEELKKHIDDVTVVNWRRVIKYQNSNPDWASTDKAKLGKPFNANFVLYISLVEFTLREPGSLNLCRGRITADVSLYQCSAEARHSCIWREDDIRVLYPEKGHSQLLETNRQIQELSYKTVMAFVTELGRKFYKHEVPEES
jgi:hypothetical protein